MPVRTIVLSRDDITRMVADHMFREYDMDHGVDIAYAIKLHDEVLATDSSKYLTLEAAVVSDDGN